MVHNYSPLQITALICITTAGIWFAEEMFEKLNPKDSRNESKAAPIPGIANRRRRPSTTTITLDCRNWLDTVISRPTWEIKF